MHHIVLVNVFTQSHEEELFPITQPSTFQRKYTPLWKLHVSAPSRSGSFSSHSSGTLWKQAYSQCFPANPEDMDP